VTSVALLHFSTGSQAFRRFWACLLLEIQQDFKEVMLYDLIQKERFERHQTQVI
jgi:hypothetical protein